MASGKWGLPRRTRIFLVVYIGFLLTPLPVLFVHHHFGWISKDWMDDISQFYRHAIAQLIVMGVLGAAAKTMFRRLDVQSAASAVGAWVITLTLFGLWPSRDSFLWSAFLDQLPASLAIGSLYVWVNYGYLHDREPTNKRAKRQQKTSFGRE